MAAAMRERETDKLGRIKWVLLSVHFLPFLHMRTDFRVILSISYFFEYTSSIKRCKNIAEILFLRLRIAFLYTTLAWGCMTELWRSVGTGMFCLVTTYVLAWVLNKSAGGSKLSRALCLFTSI